MKKLFTMMLLLATSVIFAQGTLTGTITDPDTNMPLPGANVMEAGTSNGTTTDFDGRFSLEVQGSEGEIVVSYLGFTKKKLSFSVNNGGTLDLGEIGLEADANSLGAIVVVGKGIIDLEEDRKTPIAVSTVTSEEIQKRAVGNVEFPQILKNTPNVYVSNASGGFGDSQMFVRGFDQSNTAYLLNGQPINGMEDGNMYWSNWAGLADIANAVQVQRGLGSSKLAISSVGGTVNIVTKATNRTEGGFARFLVGNGSYMKGTVSYDTGINENGWGFSFLLDYWQAHSKWANGTKGQGQNYFFSVGKKAGNHNFNFLITGAPQWHDQNFSKDLALYDEYGLKYNNNYGFNNGDYLTSRRNYYHKPVFNLNWDWEISEKSNLSTVVYASFGRGGGTGTYGNGLGYIDGYPNANEDLQGGAFNANNGLIDWTYIENVYNASIVPDGNGNRYAKPGSYEGTILRASVNNHAWYGTVMNYENSISENLTFNVGADFRFYKGDHFRQITDLLGLDGVQESFGGNDNNIVTKTFNPDPWAALFDFADENQRIDYDYSENINYQGGFGQVEWANDEFSVFAQGAISNQSYKREDRGNFAGTRESETEHKLGYNVKGGASWTFIEGHTIFANAGNYSRQPFLDNVFPSYDDNTRFADPEVDNEEIVGIEAGYRFEKNNFQLNLNGYITTWENRFLNQGGNLDIDGDGSIDYEQVAYLYTDIAQKHKGIELDMTWKPMEDWQLRGYATINEWRYDGESPYRIRDNNNSEIIFEGEADLQGVRIGQAPQASTGLGANYQIIPQKLSTYIDWNYYANLWGIANPEDAFIPGYQPEKLNPYSLFDVGASYNLDLGEQKFVITGNIYNVLDHEYISQKDNYGYFYGNGTTWNFSVKYRF